MRAGRPGPDSTHSKREFDQKPSDGTFNWGHFLTDATRAGVQFTLPRFSTQGGGSSMWSGSPMGQTGMGQMGMGSGTGQGGGRSGIGGMQNGPGANFSSGSAMGLGSSLLQSLANSTGGNLGSSLHIVSSFMNSSGGYSAIKTDGMDLRLSTSFGGGMGAMGGAMGGGMRNKGPQGPSLNLKLKF